MEQISAAAVNASTAGKTGIAGKAFSIPLAIFSAIGIALAIAAGSYTGLCAFLASSNTIWPGIEVLGQELGGLSVDQAASRLNDVIPGLTAKFYLYEQNTVPPIHTGEPDYTIPLRDLGLHLDARQIAQEAYEMNVQDTSFFNMGWQYLTGEGILEYRAALILDREKKEAESQKAADALSYPVTTFDWSVSNDVLYATRSIDGRAVNASDVENKLDTIISDVSVLSFDIPYHMVTADMVDVDAIHEAVYLETRNAYYDKNAKDVAPGQHGVDFDVAAFLDKLYAADQGETVSMPLTVTTPAISRVQMKAVLFRDVLGEASTPLTGGSARINNVRLASNAINGTVINAGETFSYNATTGQRTVAKGYQAAPAYVNGLTVDEIGGGVCQPSSTLYLATLRSNLQITERYAHRYIPSYIDPGMDATVSWGGPDYKFTNNTDYPIKVVSFLENGRIYVRLVGTNVTGYYARMSNELLSTTPYTTVYQKDPKLANGTVSVTPYTGYKYKTYRSVYDADGNLISTKYEDTSDYKKRDKVIIRNPVPAAPAAATAAAPASAA